MEWKKNGQHEFPKASGKLAKELRMQKATSDSSWGATAFVETWTEDKLLR